VLDFDQRRGWKALEERLARTENARHRQLLETVIEHVKAEVAMSLDRLMGTLVDEPNYHFWVAGKDVGPKGRQAVREYYMSFLASGGAIMQTPKERIVVDDDNVVHEGVISNIVPGRVAKARGYHVDDEDAHYLVRFRNVVLWTFDAEGLALGEDSYTAIDPDDFDKVDEAELPAVYVEYLDRLAAHPDQRMPARTGSS
jgi:hypothetical protein